MTSVLLGALALTTTARVASAHTNLHWCESQQLALSNARGAHTHQNSTSASSWVLQLRNHSRSACTIGSALDFVSVRTRSGAVVPVKVRYEVQAFGKSPTTFVLEPGASAFAQMTDPIAMSPQRDCATPAKITFELPHHSGRLSVETPDSTSEKFSVCPRLWIAVSPIYSAAAYDAYKLRLSTTAGRAS